MAFTRPTLQQIIDRIKGDFKTGLSLQAILRRSFLAVFATAFGGAVHTLHGHISFAINKLFFPDTGIDETVIRWGSLYQLDRNQVQRAELTIDVTVTAAATLPVDTPYVRADGVPYKVKAEVVFAGAGTQPATIIEDTQPTSIGADGNMSNGDKISLQSAIANINSEAEVTATELEGEDLEDIEDYRVRVLERMRFPPGGGKVTDYIAFAKTVTGVTRVWVLPALVGEGTVGLTFVEDGNVPASIIPSPAKVQEVQEAVLALQPINADLFTFAPNELEMNPEIQLKPNDSETQAAVIAELEDLLEREAEVRDASDPKQVGLGVQFTGIIPISKIDEAISIAGGETDHKLLSPTSDVQPQSGGLVTLGTPVFSALP